MEPRLKAETLGFFFLASASTYDEDTVHWCTFSVHQRLCVHARPLSSVDGTVDFPERLRLLTLVAGQDHYSLSVSLSHRPR